MILRGVLFAITALINEPKIVVNQSISISVYLYELSSLSKTKLRLNLKKMKSGVISVHKPKPKKDTVNLLAISTEGNKYSEMHEKLSITLVKSNGDSEKFQNTFGCKIKSKESKTVKHRQVDPQYEFSIQGPLRYVLPYYFTYKTFCKLRWRNKKLLDIFMDEFRDRDVNYYKKVIASGSVLLNGKPSKLDSVVENGDLISHRLHRHEPPVTSKPIKIVHEDENILVIDKPAGIPVHPTGRYRFNTVTKILKMQLGYTVHPCNRLDRLTSGLMFLAKTPKGADAMADQMKAGEVKKEYIARVVGEFPIGDIVVEKPLKTIEPKLGLNTICEEGANNSKTAKTRFKRISYDGKTSIVKCSPYTGRTHQIRVHLQYLGHPVANDPLYSNLYAWGLSLGKRCKANYDEVIERLSSVGKTRYAESWYYPSLSGEILKGENCSECGAELYTDPGPNDLDLWLHSYSYESTKLDENGNSKWNYHTDYPDWAISPHKKYMELAIEEAKKCEPVKTAFNVGAVLVNGTEILSTGYSRELPGNTHAEQCAIEKYLTRSNSIRVPPGTVCYTTMEPCSIRMSGMVPCTSRIIKQCGNISVVFFGITEPDTFVKNTSKAHLSKCGIDYIHIPGYEIESNLVATKGH